MKKIDQQGQAFIKFEPPIVMVPNDWKRLFDSKEREKMSLQDQESFDKELIKIMHVQFEKNSYENPQKFVISNLTSFEPEGIRISLNFSDPILVSQGANADKIKIKLLKSYFMTPRLAFQGPANRQLAEFEEDEEYLIIVEDIPR